ncbi:MAG: phosphoribosylglycinamide formyltransferase [Gammaproteobacteria bacterium]|nr:MAG: phosphoribosylglycinamide formyltransferase [Gammaproteobacteria bacterium]
MKPGAQRKLPAVILISGRGSNLRAIIEAARGGLPIEIRAVISNRPDAPGLAHARDSGLPTEVLSHTQFSDRTAYDQALQKLIDGYAPELVLLAGFMRVLTPRFVAHYRGRMLNIHPSLLPAFPGLHTAQRALEAGTREHGASVHFVTEQVDGGPVVLQAKVPVMPGDTPETLNARVLEQEHRIYPQAIRWFAEGRLKLVVNKDGTYATLDGQRLKP